MRQDWGGFGRSLVQCGWQMVRPEWMDGGKKGCDENCYPDLAACCTPHTKPCQQLYLQVWLLLAFTMNILLFPVPWWTLHAQLLQLCCRARNSLAPGFLLRVSLPLFLQTRFSVFQHATCPFSYLLPPCSALKSPWKLHLYSVSYQGQVNAS